MYKTIGFIAIIIGAFILLQYCESQPDIPKHVMQACTAEGYIDTLCIEQNLKN